MTRTIKDKYQSNNITISNDNIFDSAKLCVDAGRNGCSVIIPHVCNNINLFGAGFAAAVAKQYPIVKENFHLLGNKSVLGHTQFITVYQEPIYKHKLIIANMIAQNGIISANNSRPLNYYALARCMSNISRHIVENFDSDNRVQIHAPKFGSGLAGGNWLFIKDLIQDIWNNIPVFIYQYK